MPETLASTLAKRVPRLTELMGTAMVEARWEGRVREALDLVEPRVGLNLLVYTPDEIVRAETAGPSFIRDEILAKGKGRTLFPADGEGRAGGRPGASG